MSPSDARLILVRCRSLFGQISSTSCDRSQRLQMSAGWVCGVSIRYDQEILAKPHSHLKIKRKSRKRKLRVLLYQLSIGAIPYPSFRILIGNTFWPDRRSRVSDTTTGFWTIFALVWYGLQIMRGM